MNHSILSNEDLATMCAEALESAEARGLWGIKVDQYGMFDAAWDISRDSTNCNAIINDSDRVASTHVADSEPVRTFVDLLAPCEPNPCLYCHGADTIGGHDKDCPAWNHLRPEPKEPQPADLEVMSCAYCGAGHLVPEEPLRVSGEHFADGLLPEGFEPVKHL